MVWIAQTVDTVAHRSIFEYKRTLNPNGLCVILGGSRGSLLQAALLGPVISRTSSKHLGINWWSKPYNKEDMDFLGELHKTGKVIPVIDKQVPLSEVPEALKHLEEGQVLGKVVIAVEQDNTWQPFNYI